jgi:hypothetical protein
VTVLRYIAYIADGPLRAAHPVPADMIASAVSNGLHSIGAERPDWLTLRIDARPYLDLEAGPMLEVAVSALQRPDPDDSLASIIKATALALHEHEKTPSNALTPPDGR